MPLRSSPPRRPTPRSLQAFPLALASCAVLLARPARAEFSEPPESPYRPEEPPRHEPPREPEPRVDPWEPSGSPSTFRLHVGPAMLLEPAGPGLFTARDLGRRA